MNMSCDPREAPRIPDGLPANACMTCRLRRRERILRNPSIPAAEAGARVAARHDAAAHGATRGMAALRSRTRGAKLVNPT